jgi:hypothetical protein
LDVCNFAKNDEKYKIINQVYPVIHDDIKEKQSSKSVEALFAINVSRGYIKKAPRFGVVHALHTSNMHYTHNIIINY